MLSGIVLIKLILIIIIGLLNTSFVPVELKTITVQKVFLPNTVNGNTSFEYVVDNDGDVGGYVSDTEYDTGDTISEYYDVSL